MNGHTQFAAGAGWTAVLLFDIREEGWGKRDSEPPLGHDVGRSCRPMREVTH